MKKDIHVLIVDDDTMICDCMVAFFEDEGFSVHSSDSAEAALAVLPSVKPDICITDLRLSGMNGEMFIRKAHSICPDAHYLIHTGSSYVLPNELRSLGMDSEDVLLKPVHDLVLLVKRLESRAVSGKSL